MDRFYMKNGKTLKLEGARLEKRIAEEAAWPIELERRAAAEVIRIEKESALNELIDERVRAKR